MLIDWFSFYNCLNVDIGFELMILLVVFLVVVYGFLDFLMRHCVG